jgi:hypothetical protein
MRNDGGIGQSRDFDVAQLRRVVEALETTTQEGNALQLQYAGGYGALRKTLHEGALRAGRGSGRDNRRIISAKSWPEDR